ncbi:MAG: hypothetical protein KDK74_15750, partial [Cephaloticoccus sp.]|nr:hypothetical protein [Cephaloticoccus sp.]
RWVAGSDRFTRSAPFNGTDETDAATAGLVHVAITYAADGTVTGYRDGQPYGKPFRVAPLADYPAHEGQLLLGCRHGRGGGNRLLTGRIARARFYDRALSAEEIARTRSLEDTTLREADLIAALSPAQRTELENLRRELASIESQLQTTRSQASPLPPETQAWADLAQALLNTKEFLYLR